MSAAAARVSWILKCIVMCVQLSGAMRMGYAQSLMPMHNAGGEGAISNKYHYPPSTKNESGTAPVVNTLMINVDWYGAVGDGMTDDTQAVADAWGDACASSAAASSIHLTIPAGRLYLVNALQFAGPCAASSIFFELAGDLVAPSDPKSWNRSSANNNAWLQFKDLRNVRLHGGGGLDGRGQLWWAQSCKRNKTIKCSEAPTALKFSNVRGLEVVGIRSLNSPQMHIILSRCTGVRMLNVRLKAPANSPNTDGIHVSASHQVLIQDSTIATGDDCISIVNHSDDIQAKNITCGPGHGISVGSLGRGGFHDRVARVMIDGAKLVGTTNGLRIKTWRGGSGSAADLRFENVDMDNVSFPIIIDQNYCDPPNECPKMETSAVEVRNVVYRNIRGTSATKQGIKLACSNVVPCTGLHFDNINLRPVDIHQLLHGEAEGQAHDIIHHHHHHHRLNINGSPSPSSSYSSRNHDELHHPPSSSTAAAQSITSHNHYITSFCQNASGVTTGTVIPTLDSCFGL